ncbi:MAG: thiamine pyrophosphate-binding protein [Nitrospinota bacterium]|jgi:acetolactate synthase-1/2/3 large subunit|nr:thiamine pyrophosphate-binding protein [Nitrospinota bacterium]
MVRMRTSTAIAKFLERAGTEYFFGYVGHGNWALLDALASETRIKGIRTRCEDHAVHMADCFYRMRRGGPPPVVCTTGGPGATNIVGPLAEAFYEDSAMVVLVGAGPSQWFDRGGIQESYRYGPEEWIQMVKPISKKALMVNRPDTTLEMVVRAYKTACTGRPGPVVVQVPFDIQNTETEVREIPDPRDWALFHPPGPDGDGVRRAADLIAASERPFVLVSTGLLNAGAWAELLEFSEGFHLPVGTTFAGKGAFPEDHPLYVGIPGRFGDEHGVRTAEGCDLLISIGNRFTDLTTAGWTVYDIPETTKLIQIDIDPEEIARVYPTEVAIVSDPRLALRALIDELKGRGLQNAAESPWLRQINDWRAEWREKVKDMRESDISPLHYARLYHEAGEVIREVDPETSILIDTGASLCFAPSFLKAPSQFISTNNDHFIRMGWSVPGLIGAQLANPSHPAVAFVGDGSFMMTGTAVATAVEYDIPAVWVVLNNRSVQFERRMKKFYGKEVFCDYRIERTGELWNPDFLKMGEALGAEVMKLERPEEIKPTLRKALEAGRPVVVDTEIDINIEPYNPTAFAYAADFHERGLEKPPF